MQAVDRVDAIEHTAFFDVGVIGKVLAEHVDRVISEVIQIQQQIGLRHDGQPIGNTRRLLHVFHNVLPTVERRHIGATPEVVVGDVDLMPSQHVAHMHHALPGVGRVGTVGIAS